MQKTRSAVLHNSQTTSEPYGFSWVKYSADIAACDPVLQQSKFAAGHVANLSITPNADGITKAPALQKSEISTLTMHGMGSSPVLKRRMGT